MDALQGLVPDTWLAWITAVVTICAAVTVVLPAPKEGGSKLYSATYRIIQWVGLNMGKAKNAQDVQDVQQKTVPSDGKR